MDGVEVPTAALPLALAPTVFKEVVGAFDCAADNFLNRPERGLEVDVTAFAVDAISALVFRETFDFVLDSLVVVARLAFAGTPGVTFVIG